MYDLPVHDDSVWQSSLVHLCVLPQGLGDGGTHEVLQLLLRCGVDVSHGDVPGEGGVETGHHGTHRLALVQCVVVGIVANDHSVSQRHVDSPGLSSQLAVHLDGDLGGHGHHSLGFVEDGAGHNLGRNGLLNATLLLDGCIVLTLDNRIG